jgi:hypothetical protein
MVGNLFPANGHWQGKIRVSSGASIARLWRAAGAPVASRGADHELISVMAGFSRPSPLSSACSA